ncbi:MAG: hypothetical protein AABW64_01810 [Nanoarchaeota archaeon]
MKQNYLFSIAFVFFLSSSFFFVSGAERHHRTSEAGTLNSTLRIYFVDTPQGNAQNKYTMDLALLSTAPLIYSFDVVSYELSYKYGGVIKWKQFPQFPHGEGLMAEIPGTGRMNITGWLGDQTLPNRFFGLMSLPDLTMNQTLYWIVGKEINSAQVMYGTYWINDTYFP